MPKVTINLEVGKKYAGMTLLDETSSGRKADRKCRVEHACGHEGEYSRKHFLLRIRERNNLCPACKFKGRMAELDADDSDDPDGAEGLQVIVKGWGMTLGKMGHRHGEGPIEKQFLRAASDECE